MRLASWRGRKLTLIVRPRFGWPWGKLLDWEYVTSGRLRVVAKGRERVRWNRSLASTGPFRLWMLHVAWLRISLGYQWPASAGKRAA